MFIQKPSALITRLHLILFFLKPQETLHNTAAQTWLFLQGWERQSYCFHAQNDNLLPKVIFSRKSATYLRWLNKVKESFHKNSENPVFRI